jgi:DNA-binding GntR family transcriptional regulator
MPTGKTGWCCWCTVCRARRDRCPTRTTCDALAEEAYRFRQVAAGKSFTKRNEHAEHLAIFEAAIAGQADEAARLLTEHYTRTSTLVATQARKRGHAA